MRRGLVATTTLAVVFAAGVVGAASAQFGGPMGMGSMPTMSNMLGLLQRTEVQNAISLDLNQKKAIEELQTKSGAEMRERMMQQFQGNQGLSREERMQKMQEARGQIQGQMQAFQGELNERVKAILKEPQVKRLHELDLQRRGILALADPKVAEEMRIAPLKRTQIVAIVTGYQTEMGQYMQGVMQQMFGQGGPGEPGGQGGQRGGVRNRQGGGPGGFQFPDFQSPLSPHKQKLDALKKAAEAKVTALLSDEEKARWSAALGEKFTFKADPPFNPQQMMRRRGGA